MKKQRFLAVALVICLVMGALMGLGSTAHADDGGFSQVYTVNNAAGAELEFVTTEPIPDRLNHYTNGQVISTWKITNITYSFKKNSAGFYDAKFTTSGYREWPASTASASGSSYDNMALWGYFYDSSDKLIDTYMISTLTYDGKTPRTMDVQLNGIKNPGKYKIRLAVTLDEDIDNPDAKRHGNVAQAVADYIAKNGQLSYDVNDASAGLTGTGVINYSPTTGRLIFTLDPVDMDGYFTNTTRMEIDVKTLGIVKPFAVKLIYEDFISGARVKYEYESAPDNFVPENYVYKKGNSWNITNIVGPKPDEVSSTFAKQIAEHSGTCLDLSISAWNSALQEIYLGTVSSNYSLVNIGDFGFTSYIKPANGTVTHVHTYSTAWTTDANYHWHAAICKVNTSCTSARSDYAAHTFGNWNTVKAATATTTGLQERYCQICNYKATNTIPATNSANAITDKIKAAANGSQVSVSVNSTDTIPASAFDALKGTTKTLIATLPNGVSWVFKGADIKGTSKDIKLATTVALLSNNSALGQLITSLVKGVPTVVIGFPNNGALPGSATVRVPLTADMVSKLGTTGISAYYVNESSKALNKIASNLRLSPNNYAEFSISHNSTYILTKGSVGNTTNNNTNNNTTNKPENNNSSNLEVVSRKVFRMYNMLSGEHLYSIDVGEVKSLLENGWVEEISPGYASVNIGKPVYRLYNPLTGEHLYTVKKRECKILTRSFGWVYDNGGRPVFFSVNGGKRAVYRLFNYRLNPISSHIYTSDVGEVTNLLNGHGYLYDNNGTPIFYLK